MAELMAVLPYALVALVSGMLGWLLGANHGYAEGWHARTLHAKRLGDRAQS
jgi:hypothetical protein